MRRMFRKHAAPILAVALAALIAGCAVTKKEEPASVQPDTSCRAAAGERLVGGWLGVRRVAGVAGELRTYIQLRADGTMVYEEQLRRPRQLPQGLKETGCWHREGSILVLRTVESNGSPVDLDDPIYVNRYQVLREAPDRVRLRAPDGIELDARRMPPDYRLPL